MWDSQNRRRFRRYPVSIPASINLSTSVSSFRVEINEATIVDIGYIGLGISMVVETLADHDEIARMFTRHRACQIRFKVPGNVHPMVLNGRMVWFQPRMTTHGFILRFGVLLEGNEDETMTDLREYIKSLEGEEAETETLNPPDDSSP